jgi:signal transduction histidine kinase
LREQGARLEATLAAERVARADAESANKVKDEFLTTVSHELRTPLNVILGWAATLTRHRPADETVMRGIQAIGRNAHAQARIVDDVLNFSGMVRGKLQLDVKAVALAPVVAEAVETMRAAAEGKGIRLSAALAEDTGAVMADADRLRQIVLNLVSNAIKFTPAGGEILVTTNAAGTDVQLRVEDTGIGIASAFLPHVFDPFRQADASATRAEGGLGLGLAIVRHLAELHGGSIEATSDGMDRGTVMTLRLPAAVATSV